jgi:hypothetical protein
MRTVDRQAPHTAHTLGQPRASDCAACDLLFYKQMMVQDHQWPCAIEAYWGHLGATA